MAAKLQNLDQNLAHAGVLYARDQHKRGKTGKVGSTKFSSLVKKEELAAQHEPEAQLQVLQNYLAEITEAGENLQKAPTRTALRKYRRLIQSFLEKSLENLYETQEVLGRLNISTGQRKKYSLLRIIDEKLENLVKTVLTEQNANLRILQRIEEINGLLINMLS